MTENTRHLSYLRSAADMAIRQAEEADGEYGIPLDPDVADFMGAFEETAFGEEDI